MENAQDGLQPRVLHLEIQEQDAGKTIKEYLREKIGFSSRQLSRFKYREDGILLNGARRYVNAVLEAGDVLEIRLTGLREREEGSLQKIWAAPAPWLAQNHPLSILYEDQDILAADKPSGVVCHPSPGHYDDTLSNQVAEHLGRIGQELDVRVTGRLDRDTSGIVIFALNTETAAQLIKQRQKDVMGKLYIARVRGHFEGGDNGSSGVVDRPLRRESVGSFRMTVAEDGRPAKTIYRVLRELADGTTLVSCRIEHGRTHQIRVHMSSIGHPIIGDRLYGPEAGLYGSEAEEESEPVLPGKTRPGSSLEKKMTKTRDQAAEPPFMLHAYRAVLRQPFTGEEIRLEAPLPDWAEEIEKIEEIKEIEEIGK